MKLSLAFAAALMFAAGCGSSSGGAPPGQNDGGATIEAGAAKQVGDACSGASDACGDGLVCAQDNPSCLYPAQCTFSCKKNLGTCRDNPCGPDEWCKPPALTGAAVGYCVKRAKEGEPCPYLLGKDFDTNGCDDGLFCATNAGAATCRKAAAAGQPCTKSTDRFSCAKGYVCRGDTFGQTPTCVAETKQGGSCLNDTDCAVGLLCTNQQCAPRAKPDASCTLGNTPTAACVQGYACTFDKPGECTTWIDCHKSQTACCASPNGGVCTPGDQSTCAPPSGTCQPDPHG